MNELLIDRPWLPTVLLGCLLGGLAVIGHVTFSKLVLLYVGLVWYCVFRIGQRSVGLARFTITGDAQSAKDLLSLGLGLIAIVGLSGLFYLVVVGRSEHHSLWAVIGEARFWIVSISVGIADFMLDRAYQARIGD